MESLERFLELRRDASRERIGDGGPDLCEALTAALDAAVVDLAAAAPAPATFAVVALGGYGRREQCLYSDVDLMVLHDGGEIDATAASIFRPLWDAGLKVGHSVRTPAEAASAARDRFDTLTSLLSCRLVTGDTEVFAAMTRQLARVVAGKPLAQSLAASERERRRRDPYPLLAANLKDGRGALRTLQGLGWERRRAEILGIKAAPARDDEIEALASLLIVRNGLHAVAARSHDVFSVDVREPVAQWVGREPLFVAEMLTRALATGDRLAEKAWPDILVSADPLVGFRTRFAASVRSRFLQAREIPAASPLTIAADAAERPGPVKFSIAEQELVGAEPRAWTAADRTALVRLVAGRERGRAAFTLLDRAGWVDAALPEWGAVRSTPQLAPFHDHPVDTHLWRTVDEMRSIVEGSDEWLTPIATEIGSTEELYLAAFFHDIGKGRGGDHSRVGADITQAFLRRSGFGPATSSAVVHAVRHHLLLANTALRRDTNRPEVIDEIVDAVGSLRRLQVLYLLTVADLRATGAAMWNDWKATLLRNVFVTCAERFGAAVVAEAVGAPDTTALFVEAAAAHEPRLVEEHLAAMPPGYRDVFDPDAVAWHLDLVSAHRGGINLAARPLGPASEALIVADDRPGFLAAVASAFTANGIDVLEAHLFTRDDGVVVDRFVARRYHTGDLVSDELWDRVRSDLEAVLGGHLDVSARVADRVRSYGRPDAAPIPVEVKVAEESATRHTEVSVRCGDRIGRLAQIVNALRDSGCDIHYAKLDVRGRQVVDTFLVRRDGHPLRKNEDRDALAAAVTAALEG